MGGKSRDRLEALRRANAKRPVHHKPGRFGRDEHHTLIGQALKEAGFEPEEEVDEFGKRRQRREQLSP